MPHQSTVISRSSTQYFLAVWSVRDAELSSWQVLTTSADGDRTSLGFRPTRRLRRFLCRPCADWSHCRPTGNNSNRHYSTNERGRNLQRWFTEKHECF